MKASWHYPRRRSRTNQFPHPTFKAGSEAAYGEFAQVLLAFFQRGDDFDFIARNCLFRVPLYYAMANGDHGQGWTFGGLAAYFASGVYGNTSQATRLALSAFSIYWVSLASDTSISSVTKVSINGGTPTILASGQDNTGGVAVDATSIYWVNYSFGSLPGTVMKLTPK